MMRQRWTRLTRPAVAISFGLAAWLGLVPTADVWRVDPLSAAAPPPATVLEYQTSDAPGTVRRLVLARRGEHLDLRDGDTQDVLATAPASLVSEVRVTGSTNNEDTLTLDFATGEIAPPGGIHFDGGAGGFDSLLFEGGSFAHTSYAPQGLQSGALTFDALRVSFDNLEPIIDGTAAATFTINATDAFNTITVDEGVSAFDGYFRIQVDASESIELSNKTQVYINAGVSGADFGDDIVVNVSDTTTGMSSLTIEGLGGVDILRLRRTPSNLSVIFNGGAANDALHVSDVAQQAADVAGTVVFDGGPGVGDQMFVRNDGSSLAQNVTIEFGTVSLASGSYAYSSTVEQVDVFAGSGQNVLFMRSNPATTTVTVDLQGANDSAIFGSASFDLTPLAGSIAVAGGLGTDTFAFFDYGFSSNDSYTLTSSTLTGSGVGALSYTSAENVTLQTSDGPNVVLVDSTALGVVTGVHTGGGDDQITVAGTSTNLDSSLGTLTIDGNTGADTITFDDRGNPFGDAYLMTATTLARFGFGGATFTAETVTLRASQLGNAITLSGSAASTTTTLEGNGGDDVITIQTGANAVAGPVNIVGGAGADTVTVDDTANAGSDTFLVYSTGIARPGIGVLDVDHASNEVVELRLGSGASQVSVEHAPAANALRLYLGGGNDVVQAGQGAETLVNLQGLNVVDGQGGIDTLSLYDRLNVTGIYIVSAGGLSRFAAGTGPSSLGIIGVDAVNLRASDQADSVFVQATPAPLTLDTGAGNDTVAFDSNGSVPGGTVDFIGHAVILNGGTGTNSVTFEDSSDGSTDNVRVLDDIVSTPSGNLFFGANVGVSLSNVATATLRTGSGDDVVTIRPSANIAWTVEGGAHASGDTLNLSANCGPGPTGGASSPVTFAGRLPVTHAQFETAGVVDVLTLTPLLQSVGGSATTALTLDVVSSTCTWSASAATPWITITGGGSGTGNGTVVFSVAENLSDALRTGSINVGSTSAQVQQSVSPVVTSYTPTTGSTAGGTVVTFTGYNFTDVTVYFDGVPASSQARLNVNTLAAVAPPHASGVVELRVEHTNGAAIVWGTGFRYVASTATDTDGDGMPDDWELRYGLDPSVNDASLDPDADGRTNLTEYTQDSHPRGFFKRYFAEGATSAFFSTELALFNPTTLPAATLMTFQRADGSTSTRFTSLGIGRRDTLDASTLPALAAAEFSTVIESDTLVVADRTMQWGGGYGTHTETALAAPSLTWYLAEGATAGDFDLFYLIQNPQGVAANVTVTYLRPGGVAPIVRSYTVPARSRFNIWVDLAAAELASTDVSATVSSDVPVIVERAMYMTRSGVTFLAGHESAGITTPATSWFLAEGATGDYFDLFVLIANPNGTPVTATATYLLPDGTTIARPYTVPANSRFNIWVDLEDPLLANTAVSTTLTASAPVIVERAMWWPGPTSATWHEAHNSPGAVSTGTRWAFAGGADGGSLAQQTYFLIANTSAFSASVRVTLHFEDGTSQTRTFTVPARSRFNVDTRAAFSAAVGRRFGAFFESQGAPAAQIVVERATYSDHNGVRWAGGANALGTIVP